MTDGDVLRSLESIRDRFSPILEGDAHSVLEKAKAEVRESKKQYDARVRQRTRGLPPLTWGFALCPSSPLRFKRAKVNRIALSVDLIAAMQWQSPGESPVKQDLALRVWCAERTVAFRPFWDAERVEGSVDWVKGRVMLRLHFDLGDSEQPGPRHHVQVGGTTQDEEHCWLSPAIPVPRLAHQPMDLVLLCEIVAANFHPEFYRDVSRDATWKGTLATSECCLLKPYYQSCLRSLDGGQGLLGGLWCS